MSSPPIGLGIVGLGAVARNYHLPSILENPAYRLVAVCGARGNAPAVRSFDSIETMLSQCHEVDAVAICTPPQNHYEAARIALTSGKHVLLEKPPCTSQLQLEHLKAMATARSLSLYQTWHSQHAKGVVAALEFLRERRLSDVHVTWLEDVTMWHPGNTWLWKAGGFGVFDPGINALSILTRLIEEPIFPREAILHVPSDCETPIAASITLETASGLTLSVNLDFRHTGKQTWNIDMGTTEGVMSLTAGGSELWVGSERVVTDEGQLASEYRAIYERFADLVGNKRSDVDGRPLQLVADIFLNAKRVAVEPFRARRSLSATLPHLGDPLP